MMSSSEATVAAEASASDSILQDKPRYQAASTIAPNTPVAAASVGVATPSMISPITMKNTKADGIMRTSAIIALPRGLRSAVIGGDVRRQRRRDADADHHVDQEHAGQQQAGQDAGDQHLAGRNVGERGDEIASTLGGMIGSRLAPARMVPADSCVS